MRGGARHLSSQRILRRRRGPGRGQMVSRATLWWGGLWILADCLLPGGPQGAWPASQGFVSPAPGPWGACRCWALRGPQCWGSLGAGVAGRPRRWKWLAGIICLLQWGDWGLVPSGSQGCVPLSTEGRPFSWWPAHLLWAVFPSCSLTPARPGAQMNSQARGVRRALVPARGVGVGSRAVLRSPGLCLFFWPGEMESLLS